MDAIIGHLLMCLIASGEAVVVDGGWTKILPASWPYTNITGSWEEKYELMAFTPAVTTK
jgi:hypothetical protein